MDWSARVLQLPREAFCAEHAHLFLFGVTLFIPPRGARTMALRQITVGPEALDGEEPRPQVLVQPVRKAHDSFESMITVGRTDSNDIVLEDVQVSKLHAFFVTERGRLELQDAGSRNGTFVGAERIYAKDGPHVVEAGQLVRFGTLTFTLLAAGPCWDAVRSHLIDRPA